MDLQQRKSGKLPEIDIAGTMFYVEVRLRELRADYKLMSRINLDKLENGPDGESYRFAFNTETKRLVDIDPKITEWPKDVVIVEIPDDLKLDPYSVARENGIDPEEFVKKHPIEKELKAKIIPLSETSFPELMEKNKKPKRKRKGKGHRL
jgi:hypothetical protein